MSGPDVLNRRRETGLEAPAWFEEQVEQWRSRVKLRDRGNSAVPAKAISTIAMQGGVSGVFRRNNGGGARSGWENFAAPSDADSTVYKSFGVSPVFLARTFIAVGPSVTLS